MFVQCPSCNSQLSVPERFAGKRAKCKKCSAFILIPANSELSEDEFVEPDDELVEPLDTHLKAPKSVEPLDTNNSMMRVACPTCSRVMQCNNDLAGQKIYCPECGQKVLVPPLPAAAASRNKTTLGKRIDVNADESYHISAGEPPASRPAPRKPGSLDNDPGESEDSDSTSSARTDRPAKKKRRRTGDRITIVRAIFVLWCLLSFALEFGFIHLATKDQMPAQPVQHPGQSQPPPLPMPVVLAILAIGPVALIILRSSQLDRWGDAIMDTSEIGAGFWVIFLCCGGLTTPILMALLASAFTAQMLYGDKKRKRDHE